MKKKSRSKVARLLLRQHRRLTTDGGRAKLQRSYLCPTHQKVMTVTTCNITRILLSNKDRIVIKVFVALIERGSSSCVLTVLQHFVYFLLSSKSHKCQKHAEQELMKMADKQRYCENLPNIFCVTLDHVWPLRYITLSQPCVIYQYCFCIVWS